MECLKCKSTTDKIYVGYETKEKASTIDRNFMGTQVKTSFVEKFILREYAICMKCSRTHRIKHIILPLLSIPVLVFLMQRLSDGAFIMICLVIMVIAIIHLIKFIFIKNISVYDLARKIESIYSPEDRKKILSGGKVRR